MASSSSFYLGALNPIFLDFRPFGFPALCTTFVENVAKMARTVAVCKDMRNREALHFAAMEGKFEVCKYLLEELELDVDPIDVDGITLKAIYCFVDFVNL